jgi:class I fructose-bisphosphate aldolase
VKPPTAHLELKEAKKVYEEKKIPIATLTDRIRNVVQSCFNGRRIVIFSGGEAKDTPTVLGEIKEIHAGGGFGSIMGRNAFQRPKAEALQLLKSIMEIYRG